VLRKIMKGLALCYYSDMPTQDTILFSVPLLLLLIQDENEREQIAQLYLQHVDLMRKVASKYFSSSLTEQEDIVSDATLRICKNFSTISRLESHKIPSYIVKVCRSVCIDRLRRQGGLEVFPGEEVMGTFPDRGTMLDALMDRKYAIDLLESFSSLSDRYKELIRMRHIDLMSFEEIAQVLGISEVSARSAVSRAQRHLKALARQLKPEDLL